MTEASPIITQTLPDDSFELRSATVGVPLPHTEVKIVDGDGEYRSGSANRARF